MKEENDLCKRFKFDFSAPESFSASVEELKSFLGEDKEAVLVFYGGEPLMEIPKIRKIMDAIHVPFRMQTNGKLLDQLPAKYLNRMDKILISIDGDKERTDYNKGEGTYDKVVSNIRYIRKNHFNGELVARMTISPEFPDLEEQVLHLLSLGFDSIHWQIDAGFYKCDYNKPQFEKFVKSYNKSVTNLVDYWLNIMKKGRVLVLYPFTAIMHSLLTGEPSKLRCGAGHAGYAINTDGKIYACPIMSGWNEVLAGTIKDSPKSLKKFDVSGRCTKCDIKDICGGRCLYWNISKLWPEDGNDLICGTVKHLVKELKRIQPEVQELIDDNIIALGYFDKEKYFGPEIIP